VVKQSDPLLLGAKASRMTFLTRPQLSTPVYGFRLFLAVKGVSGMENQLYLIGFGTVSCPECVFRAPLENFDVLGACRDNIFCPECSCEFDSETGEVHDHRQECCVDKVQFLTAQFPHYPHPWT